MSAQWVDTLVVGVTYETDEKSAKSAIGRMNGIGKSLLAGAAALTGAAVGLTGFAISQAMAQDETAKLAGTLRTSTEEMTALQYAAERSGVPMSGLHTTLERLSRSLTEAAVDAGSKSAIAFEEMGISARHADGSLKNTAAILPEIAGGLQGITDEGRRSEIMIDLLGRSSARLEGFMGQGEDGINALTDRARELGFVLDSEAAANSEALADAMLDLKSALGVVGREVGDTIIPHVTAAATAFVDWFTASDNWLKLGVDKGVEALAWSLDQLHHPLGQAVAGSIAFVGTGATLVKTASMVGTAFQMMGISIAAGTYPITAGAAVIAAGVAVFVGAGALLLGIIDEIKTTAEGGDSVMRRLADSFGLGDELARGLAAGLSIAGDTFDIFLIAMSEGSSMLIDDMKSFGGAVSDGIDWVADLATQAAEAVPMLKPLAEMLQTMADGLGAFTKGNIGGWVNLLEGAAGFTGRLADGELTEGERGGIAAVGLGGVAGTVELANLREQRGFGASRDERGAYRQSYIEAGTGAQQDAVGGFLGMFSSEAPAVPMATPRGGDVSVSPSVSLTLTGSSPAELARAAGAAVERATLEQLDELEAMS